VPNHSTTAFFLRPRECFFTACWDRSEKAHAVRCQSSTLLSGVALANFFYCMKSLVFIVLTLVVAGSRSSAAEIVKRVNNRYKGKDYEIAVSAADLISAPKWDEDRENPPLSARRAVTLARDYALRVIPNSGITDVQSISLESAGAKERQWIYVISFWADPRDRRAIQLGPLNVFRVPVLLNGNIPEPVIRDKVSPKTPTARSPGA
jgi:hypothetical protein